ncbi:hypothetical protein [Pararhodobacter zhoushanensis]|uniref:hypothetical protein n=1 Tax=Pararhodobacter zhoushanensis TaxID=2479545 RepID=UPI000F8CB684|nr:hypothetical protein [Pararhodobacter zhoushanensis]
MRGQINAADEMGKAAQRIGIPVEALSQLRYAADLSAASVTALDSGVQRLSRGMADGSDRLTALGIAARNSDGTLRPVTDVMAELADRFAAMPDGAEKTALAIELMGRSGAELIPLLNGGSAALRGMMAEADALGRTISQETATSAAQFNDAITRLQAAASGLMTQLAAGLIPVLGALAEWFSQIVAGMAGLSPEMRTLATAIAGITIVGGPALIVLGTLVRSLGALRVALVAASGPWGILAALVAAAAGYFLLFRDNAAPAQTAAEETAAAMGALNTAMGTFYTSASPQTASSAITAANALRTQAAAARDAAASQLALLEAELTRFQNAPVEERGLMTGDSEERNRANDVLAAQVDLDRARASLIEAEAAADRAVRAVTGAMSENIEVAANLTATTQTLNVAVAATGAAASGSAAAVEEVTDASEEANDRLQSQAQTLTGLFMAATRGADAARQALSQLLSRAAEALANQAFMSLLGGGSGGKGGGFLSGLLSMISFEGGGYTGMGVRAGGLDGRGGKLAMVHPDETVIDHKNGGSTGSSTFYIDARGAQQGVAEQIEQALRRAKPGIIRDSVTATHKSFGEVRPA